jgi:hypothetical protein
VSYEQLSQAVGSANERPNPLRIYKGSADTAYPSTGTNVGKTFGPSYWAEYPLDSREGVLHWIKDFQANVAADSQRSEIEMQAHNKQSPARSTSFEPDIQQRYMQVDDSLRSSEPSSDALHQSATVTEANSAISMSQRLNHIERERGDVYRPLEAPDQDEEDTGTTIISPEFQEQFLW